VDAMTAEKVRLYRHAERVGDAPTPLGEFTLPEAAAIVGLTPVWLRFLLQTAKPAGRWTTSKYVIELVAPK
jgi:hypothetical protein